MLVDLEVLELGRKILARIDAGEGLGDCSPAEVSAAEAALAMAMETERLRADETT